MPEFRYTWRSDDGGFGVGGPRTYIDPDHFDGPLGGLDPASGFQVQRIYVLRQPYIAVWSYGQALYESMQEAEYNIFSENPDVAPVLAGYTFTQALIVKAGIKELDKAIFDGDAKFVDINLGAVREPGPMMVDRSEGGRGFPGLHRTRG